jgi:predicted 3-demethylubiquinone-9 3-methyltransferase (glyoxalase superfamily)
MQKITTFLMFDGNAEEAMNFYISLFEDSKVEEISRYGQEGPGTEGKVIQALFSMNGQDFMCIDSTAKHGFSLTPAMSFFVNCDTEEEFIQLYSKLVEEGQVYMPLGKYPFSEKYSWLADKFGISWQLNLNSGK